MSLPFAWKVKAEPPSCHAAVVSREEEVRRARQPRDHIPPASHAFTRDDGVKDALTTASVKNEEGQGLQVKAQDSVAAPSITPAVMPRIEEEADGGYSSDESTWVLSSDGDDERTRQKWRRTEATEAVAGSGRVCAGRTARQPANLWARRLRSSDDRSRGVAPEPDEDDDDAALHIDASPADSTRALSSSIAPRMQLRPVNTRSARGNETSADSTGGGPSTGMGRSKDHQPAQRYADPTQCQFESGCFAYAKFGGAPWWPVVLYESMSDVPAELRNRFSGLGTLRTRSSQVAVLFIGEYRFSVIRKSKIRHVEDVDQAAVIESCRTDAERSKLICAIEEMEEMAQDGRAGRVEMPAHGHVPASQVGGVYRSAGSEQKGSFAYGKLWGCPWWPCVVYSAPDEVPRELMTKLPTTLALDAAVDEVIVSFLGDIRICVLHKDMVRTVTDVNKAEILQACKHKLQRNNLVAAIEEMQRLAGEGAVDDEHVAGTCRSTRHQNAKTASPDTSREG